MGKSECVSYQMSFNGQIDNRFHAAKKKKITSHAKFIQIIGYLTKCSFYCRFCRCIVIVRRKTRRVYFVWIIVHKKRLSHLVCTSWRVAVNMKRKLCHTYCVWMSHYQKQSGLMMANQKSRTVSDFYIYQLKYIHSRNEIFHSSFGNNEQMFFINYRCSSVWAF